MSNIDKVFPALAGINRVFMNMDDATGCVPRASGDKPFFHSCGSVI